jgi:hypothetical protein
MQGSHGVPRPGIFHALPGYARSAVAKKEFVS